jgi:tRNA wybutosine-synthesizing protein 4
MVSNFSFWQLGKTRILAGMANRLQEVQFCLLEQFFPDGPEHPFAVTMMNHFRKLHAPLLSVLKYHSLSHQERRFLDAGWSYVRAQSLWGLWQENSFISSFRKTWLDTIEPFDEWEEFALFASHYFILWASTDVEISQNSDPRQRQVDFPGDRETTAFSLKLLPNCPPRFAGRRRYGALISDSDRTLGFYGGLGQKSRLPSTDVYANSDNVLRHLRPLPPLDIASRMCHTVTSLRNGECLITGGRTSPSAPMGDCWVRQIDTWSQSHSLPLPRFRHCATGLSFNDDVEYVLVYGGKSESGDTLSDWLLWHAQSGWRSLEVAGHKPNARFGATMINTDGSSGVLFGGMTLDGRVLEDFWTWSVTPCGDGTMVVELADHTEDLQTTTPPFKSICRFGATVNMTSWGLVITGGIGVQGVVPSEYEIMILNIPGLQSYSSAMEIPWSDTVLCAVGLGMEFIGLRPLLIGHAAWAVNPSELLILGGGGVCFSFGTFWNEGTWLLQEKTSLAENRWLMVQASQKTGERLVGMPLAMAPKQLGGLRPVSRRSIRSSTEFQEIVAQARPVVITDADIGRCATLWTKEYLANTIGVDRKVGILFFIGFLSVVRLL